MSKPPAPFPHGSAEDVSQRKALLWRAAVSVVDFGEAMLNWAIQKEVKLAGDDGTAQELDTLVKRAMRSFAIVTYARPFLGSNSPKDFGQARDRLFLIQLGGTDCAGTWWIDLHNELITLRDKCIAHSDSDETGRDPIVQVRSAADGSRDIHMEMNYWWHRVDRLDCLQVMQLFHQMHDRAESLAFKLASSLLDEGHLSQGQFSKEAEGRGVGTLVQRLRREVVHGPRAQPPKD